ncbi:MAG: PAS domain-containing protein [Hyphomicrobiales bacterium]|nr:PAS domain-containing protein [Hyphomicrobiales bacterium]MDE2113285.1 PAS domain-containing protein [Hyphomicrobiales bacterium]
MRLNLPEENPHLHLATRIIVAMPNPMLTINHTGMIADANPAAEHFFAMSRSNLRRQKLADLLPFASPLLHLVEESRMRGSAINEYRVDLGTPRIGAERIVDIQVVPLLDAENRVVIMLQERTIADKMDRQLTHRGAARSVSALASMLAHEIKNPLSGIRGAAQLLEGGLGDEDRALTRLICEETDRIVRLVDRMEAFSDERPMERASVNIHAVLDKVKCSAKAGFARHVRLQETYDPSLPPVNGNYDLLVQVFLNLLKNAAEAIGEDMIDGEIEITTAYRPGVKMRTPGTHTLTSLPLEICIRDNGPGVPPEIIEMLFDPFVTTKASGTGLGLALVAKIVGDHGGIVECESLPRRTLFRVLLPVFSV